jgi:hypothetical protein
MQQSQLIRYGLCTHYLLSNVGMGLVMISGQTILCRLIHLMKSLRSWLVWVLRRYYAQPYCSLYYIQTSHVSELVHCFIMSLVSKNCSIVCRWLVHCMINGLLDDLIILLVALLDAISII